MVSPPPPSTPPVPVIVPREMFVKPSVYLPKLDLTSTEFGTRLVPDPTRALKLVPLSSYAWYKKDLTSDWFQKFKVNFLLLVKNSR